MEAPPEDFEFDVFLSHSSKDKAVVRKIAKRLREVRNRRLNDADGIAAALWGLAGLDLAEDKAEDAVPRVVEAYQIVVRLGRANGIAVIGMMYGQILARHAKFGDARIVLQRSVEMFRALGQESGARRAEEIIAQFGLG